MANTVRSTRENAGHLTATDNRTQSRSVQSPACPGFLIAQIHLHFVFMRAANRTLERVCAWYARSTAHMRRQRKRRRSAVAELDSYFSQLIGPRPQRSTATACFPPTQPGGTFVSHTELLTV